MYDSVAALLGARADEIALVENATRAWDMVFYALATSFAPGDRDPHVARRVREQRDRVPAGRARAPAPASRWCPTTSTGQLSVDALREMLDERVRLIAMSWIPTQGGLVNPAAAVGAVAREAGVPVPARRVPGRGPAPDRRRRARVRLPLGHRPEVPARHRAAPGCSTCAARGSSDWSRRSSTCTPRSGRATTRSRSAPTPAASRAGSTASPTGSASAPPSTTRSRSASTRSPRASPCSATSLRERARGRSRASRSTTSASSGAAS